MAKVIADFVFLHLKYQDLKHFISENINGILGTTIVHLILAMLFLFVKIGEVREFHQEQLLVEFTEEMASIEEIIEAYESFDDLEMPALDQQTVRSIVQNISSDIEQEISTEQFEQQVMDELGIESLEPELPEDSNEDIAIVENYEQKEELPPEEITNTIVKDNTAVTYDLENRWHRYIYIPAYKCEGGGTVVLNIEVDQQGFVTSANIVRNESTNDPCILEEAVNSARKALFNTNTSALPKQEGTITYTFLPQ